MLLWQVWPLGTQHHCAVVGVPHSKDMSLDLNAQTGFKVQLNTSGWILCMQCIDDCLNTVKKYTAFNRPSTAPPTGKGLMAYRPSCFMHCYFTALELHLCALADDAVKGGSGSPDSMDDSSHHPCLLVTFSKAEVVASPMSLQASLSRFVLSTGWITSETLAAVDWSVSKNSGGLLSVEEFAMTASPVDGANRDLAPARDLYPEADFPVLDVATSLSTCHVAVSYQRLGAVLYFVKILKNECDVALDGPDLSEMGSPADDRSTFSARSSFLSFIQGRPGGCNQPVPWLRVFGSVVLTLGSMRFLFSDDRKLTELPLLECATAGLEFEAKRGQESDIVAWSFHLAPYMNVYSRHKMGWEPLSEEWSLRVSHIKQGMKQLQ